MMMMMMRTVMMTMMMMMMMMMKSTVAARGVCSETRYELSICPDADLLSRRFAAVQ